MSDWKLVKEDVPERGELVRVMIKCGFGKRPEVGYISVETGKWIWIDTWVGGLRGVSQNGSEVVAWAPLSCTSPLPELPDLYSEAFERIRESVSDIANEADIPYSLEYSLEPDRHSGLMIIRLLKDEK